MNKTKKKIAIAGIVFIVLLGVVIALFSFESTSKNNTITIDSNMTIVNMDNVSYYDISTYGIESGIYNEADYNRLNNIQLDSNYENFSESLTAYYSNNPIFKYFLNEKLVKKTFFGNDVYFITSTNDTRLLVEKDIIMPKFEPKNISKIIIATLDGNDIIYEKETEISLFTENIEYNIKMLSESQNHQEYQVYYKNTAPNIYEVINDATLEYLT